mmetsp:Transcript_21534/g.31855  ORF Transcript_21534/g.31855 Transcript_21534/m.31855 type:complete len:416 (-) Transcript_21534:161-1408(-)
MSNSFSFHCTICFEALDSEERAPVVLPCGHTFICQQCSRRLDKCMECRCPLFVPTEANSDHTEAMNESFPRRANAPTERMALPMPKNFVLISLIESSRWSKPEKTKEDKALENNDDNNFVTKGIKQLNSDFGTYAVREREGLAISESITNIDVKGPLVNELFDNNQSKSSKEDDEGSLGPSDIFEHHNMITTQDSFGAIGHKSTEIKMLENYNNQEKLQYGRTLQIVKFEDGNATLARGAGSLQVKPGQLVKIGPARDKACQIEGRMLSLKKEREEMELKMKKVDSEISIATKELSEAVLLPFVDAAGSDCHFEENNFEEHQEQNSIATTVALTSTTSDVSSFSGSATNFISAEVVNANSQPSITQSPSFTVNTTRRSPAVDFNSGFSGYGFSRHRPHGTPQKKQPGSVRRLSTY